MQTAWQEDTELLFPAAVAEDLKDREEAMRHFEAGLATWDGTGFNAKVNRTKSPYATYKLALALIAASRWNRLTAKAVSLVNRLVAMQSEDGGIATDDNAQGRPVGQANIKTTRWRSWT